MAEEHLIAMMVKRYKTMVPEKRIVEVRKLARQSTETREFLKQNFPDFYKEAYPND
jgi:hypothetical protein